MKPAKEVKKEQIVQEETNTLSIDENVEVGSGCVADMSKVANPTMAQKELQMKDILNSPMLNKAKELFDIKKITVKSKT